MRKKQKKLMWATLGAAGISLVGKTIYEYHKEDPDQSTESWLLQRLFGMFSKPLSQFESNAFYKHAIQLIGKINEETIDVPELDTISTRELMINDMQTILLNDKKDSKQDVIFFLHGGAYLAQPAPFHFNMLEDIIKQTDAKVVMPIYPKAPNYDYKDAYPKILEAYRLSLKYAASPKNITIMGDSAGGGLTVGLSSLLADKNFPQPKQLVLISPWLDAASENPKMKEYEETDTILPSQFYFKATGRLWANGEENIYEPLVSPLYTNNLSELPPTYIIAGKDEMLYPDILRFIDFMAAENQAVKLFSKENMVHDYPIFDTSEGKEARKLISRII